MNETPLKLSAPKTVTTKREMRWFMDPATPAFRPTLMKTIPLTQGQVALVDDSDYEALSAFRWYAKRAVNSFYACRNARTSEGRRIHLWMHQVILPGHEEVDHIDGFKLNNQRYNLRGATKLQNRQAFKSKRKDSSSPFRGVSWHKLGSAWQAEIKDNRVHHYLGLFKTESEAARAYDVAARHYFKDRAQLNFP